MDLPYYEFEVGKSSMIFDFFSEGVKGKNSETCQDKRNRTA